MSGEVFEIRWHGRGGQGAKTASELLVKAAIEKGKYIQSLPEFGAESQGAPMQAYSRISSTPILIHTAITHPDMVVVVDETLLKSIPVCEGLSDKGLLLVNSNRSNETIKKDTGCKGHVFTIDATQIAIDEIGKPIPNAPMLGAVARITKLVELDVLKERFKEEFIAKVGEQIANNNLKAIERAYKEVKG